MIYLIHVLLLLLIQKESRCQDKTDQRVVTFCPTLKEEWDRAAQKKNCSKFEPQYEYHCLINAYLNETLEVCAPKKWIFGYCAEFNVAGRFIQNHEEAKCNENFPRCEKAYSSADAYKYPDCYQIVYDNRKKDCTTYLPHRKTTFKKSKDVEDDRNTRSFAAAIFSLLAVIMFIMITTILVNHCIKKKRTGKKSNEFDKEEVKHLTDIEIVKATNEGKESIKYFHFKVKNFEHFKYIYNLTRNYTQNDGLLNEIKLEDIILKIGVVGKYTDDNLDLLPKGKTNLNGKIPTVWEAVPVLCFQNDLSLQSALETLHQNCASHSILVTSEPVCETDKGDDSITIIGQNKEEIMKTITICLEQPFRLKLEQLLKDLPNKDSSRLASKRSGEIKALLKEIRFDNNEETVTENLPDDIQDYLLRSDGVKRAELGPSSLHMLSDKTTDEKLMEDGLTMLNLRFLGRFQRAIQKKRKGNDKKINYSTCGNIAPKGNKCLYTICRNALKKYKSDTEKENENLKDLKDSHRKKTENKTEDNMSLKTAVSKNETQRYTDHVAWIGF